LGKSHSAVRTRAYGVKKWLSQNGVKVDWGKIQMSISQMSMVEDRAPTKDDLKKLLNRASSSRDRAVIFVASSSMLRIGTLLSLRVGDVNFDYPDVASITVERKKGRKFASRSMNAGKYFVTFITPEDRSALKEYLAERENAGENVKPDSPLICDSYHKGDFTSITGFGKVWLRLLARAGLGEKSQSWSKLHFHTLRKFFRSNCIGVDASFRERWMGHKGLYLDASYFKAEENLHLAKYRKVVPYLTIFAVPTEEKRLRNQMLVDLAKIQGFEEDRIRKLEEILARAKDTDEAITEFRRLEDEGANSNGSGKHLIAKGEPELLRRLDQGYNLVKSMSEDRFPHQKP